MRDEALVALSPGTKFVFDIEDIGYISGQHDITSAEAAANLAVRKRGARTLLTGGVVISLDATGPEAANDLIVRPNSAPGETSGDIVFFAAEGGPGRRRGRQLLQGGRAGLLAGADPGGAAGAGPAGAAAARRRDRARRRLRVPHSSLGERTAANHADDSSVGYGYDQASRLTSATTPAGTTGYAYDGDGVRAAKTTGPTTKHAAYDHVGGAGLPLILDDGDHAYIYGPGGLPIEQVAHADGALTQLHVDQLGSVRLLTDAGGNTAGTYTYDAYGTTTSHTGTAASALGYAGQYRDAETGLYYLRARYYDPATAQFLTRDPLYAQTLSAYGYAGNNPLAYTDPSGLDWGAWIAAGAAIGAVIGGVACVIAEPCGAAAGLALAGGGAVGGGISFGTAVGAGAAAGAAGGAGIAATDQLGMALSEASDDCVDPRDVHGELRGQERDVDADYVWENGDLYLQSWDGQGVRVLDNGNGTSDVVVRDLSNPTGRASTKMRVPNRYIEDKINSGEWM